MPAPKRRQRKTPANEPTQRFRPTDLPNGSAQWDYPTDLPNGPTQRTYSTQCTYPDLPNESIQRIYRRTYPTDLPDAPTQRTYPPNLPNGPTDSE